MQCIITYNYFIVYKEVFILWQTGSRVPVRMGSVPDCIDSTTCPEESYLRPHFIWQTTDVTDEKSHSNPWQMLNKQLIFSHFWRHFSVQQITTISLAQNAAFRKSHVLLIPPFYHIFIRCTLHWGFYIQVNWKTSSQYKHRPRCFSKGGAK